MYKDGAKVSELKGARKVELTVRSPSPSFREMAKLIDRDVFLTGSSAGA